MGRLSLFGKLCSLRESLKIWNRVVFGDLKFKKQDLLNCNTMMGRLEEVGSLSSEQRDERGKVTSES